MSCIGRQDIALGKPIFDMKLCVMEGPAITYKNSEATMFHVKTRHSVTRPDHDTNLILKKHSQRSICVIILPGGCKLDNKMTHCGTEDTE